MKKGNLGKGWEAFLHWKGWAATAAFVRNCWRGTIRWSGWKIIFALPFPLALILFTACAAGLVWVFARGLENQVQAYFLYAASAYTLAALCVKLPGAIGGGKRWFARHPKLSAFLHNKALRFQLKLYVEQFINFAYGIFKIASGVHLGSAWIGCDGIYNMAQAMIQLFQILRRKNPGSPERQWKSYRLCGVLILLLHLTLVGLVFQMVNWNRAQEQGEILVITTALFAFYKLTSGFVGIARDRKHIHPVDSSVRMLKLAQAFFAIFSLQATMFHTFGTGESWEHLFNSITGCTVCLLIVSTGIYMIRRGSREIRKIKETQYGE